MLTTTPATHMLRLASDRIPSLPGVEQTLSDTITRLLRAELFGRALLVICVGTPLTPGDRLGPLIGTLLDQSLEPWRRLTCRVAVSGTLSDPIHATNLADRVPLCDSADVFVLAVDAAVGTPGEIAVRLGPLRPGMGLGRDLPPVGSAHILGAVAASPVGFWHPDVQLVEVMAVVIARAVIHGALSVRLLDGTRGGENLCSDEF